MSEVLGEISLGIIAFSESDIKLLLMGKRTRCALNRS